MLSENILQNDFTKDLKGFIVTTSKRKESDVMDVEEIQKAIKARQSLIQSMLKTSGITTAEIAKEMNVNIRSVQRWLNSDNATLKQVNDLESTVNKMLGRII